MKLNTSACLATAAAAIVLAAPLLIAQAAKPDAKEMAAVERIRARIEERSKKTAADKPAAYKVTIPDTTVSYGMAPIPAGEFTMGSSAPGAKPDEQPVHKVKVDAFWMQTHEITWDQALNSQVSLVPKPVDWTAKHEVPGLAIPGRTQVV